eukprot:TRINITY_DN821_c0_g1_i1.p1 TRINITY_DN821_c0_g1~~TRINITY_DN821_c0_g1_i1.p1  ORF type:complete len:526 (-),score=52.67 TRINITY_DN821_c0_g1_i1:1894-3471(-)
MTFNVVLLPLIAVLASITSATLPHSPIPPLQLITSPQSCLSDIECPLDQYCKPPDATQNDFFFGTGSVEASTCVPRLPERSNCTNVGLSECEQGTFCGFVDDFNPSPLTCLRQLPSGASCALSATAPCRDDLVCEIEPTCRAFTFGFGGDFCQFDRHCQQQQGFYCRSNFNQCTAKRPPGGACALEPENFECEGFCVNPEQFGRQPGVCQRLQTAGEKCNDDTQCQTIPFPFQTSRTDDLLCNKPTGAIGTCVLQSDLIRRLGAHCDPTNDTCDARRGLSCGPVGEHFKCVQRAASPDSFLHYCTPNSPLSSCPPDDFGNLRECRRSLNSDKQFEGVFACRIRRQVVPLGNPCSVEEFAVCAPGAVCAEAPGVDRPVGRFPPPPLRTCMKVLPSGAPCADQFRFKCEQGSFCVDGTCEQAETPPTVAIEFASVAEDCSELSCPPGTECTADSDVPDSAKICRLPVQEVELWKPCFQAAQFRLVSFFSAACYSRALCVRLLTESNLRFNHDTGVQGWVAMFSKLSR